MPSPPASTEPERWFLLAGTRSYPEGSQFAELRYVPDEIAAMRRTLSRLGLVEVHPERSDADGRDSRWLRRTLNDWLAALAEQRDGAERVKPARLVVYYTGHGYYDERDGSWLLPGREGDPRHPEDTMISAADLVKAVLKNPVLDECVLILDACYADLGAVEAASVLGKVTTRDAARVNLCVISTAARDETAKQLAFADAFAAAVARADDRDEFLDVEELIRMVNEDLPLGQQAMPLTRRAAPSALLPNPRHMPVAPPLWLDASWRAVVRGVEERDERGWFFTGRHAALDRLAEYLAGDEPGPLLVTGARGCGKSALLGWAFVTGNDRMRERLPPAVVERRPGVPGGLVSAAVRVGYRHSADDLARDIAGQLQQAGVETADGLVARLAGAPGRHGVLVDLTHDQPVHDAPVTELLTRLGALPCVRLVVAVRGVPPPADGCATAALRLDRMPDTTADIRSYLHQRLVSAPGPPYGGSTARRRDAENVAHQLAPLCRASFRAAARALRRLFDGGSLDAVRATAADALHADLVGTLQDLGRDPAWATGLVAPLTTSPEAVPEALWPDLATRLGGRAYTGADVAEAVEVAATLLSRTGAGAAETAWRLPVLPPQSASVPAERIVAALRDLVPVDGRGAVWSTAHPYLLRSLLRHLPATGAVRPYLLEPGFLLAALPASTDPVFGAPDVSDVAGPLREICAVLRSRSRAGRPPAFLLALLARRHGLDELAEAASTPELRWRPELVLGADEGGAMYALDVADDVACVAHDDGAVALRRLSTGERLGVLAADPERGTPSALAVAARPDGTVTALGRADGSVDVWRVDADRAESVIGPGGPPVTSLAWTPDGRLMVPTVTGWTALDPWDGRPTRRATVGGATEFVRAAGGRAAVAVARGRTQVLPIAADGSPAGAGTTVLFGGVRGLALSPDGLVAAWIDARGDLGMHARGRTAQLRNPAPAMDVAAGNDLVAVVGGRWLRLYDPDLAEVTELPWVDPPTGVRIVGDSVVVQSASTLTVLSRIR
jgi:hypothetical protein